MLFESRETEQQLTGAMLGKVLPELSMFLAVVLLLINPDGLLTPHPMAITVAVAAEGVTLMFFCTLVDIASRVQRRPPWWVVILIVGGLLLMYPEVINVLRMAFEEGLWVFLPLAWSFFERLRELWTLPGVSKAEKIRRRTLTFDRLWVGLVIGVVAVAVVIGVAMLSEGGFEAVLGPAISVTVLVFYGIAAGNAWRVHQPAFAQRPTSLVPWLDRGEGKYLSPL